MVVFKRRLHSIKRAVCFMMHILAVHSCTHPLPISCPSLARFSRSHGLWGHDPLKGKRGWGRESERCAIVVGKMRESTCDPLRLWHWNGLPQVFIPAAPIRAGEFIITNMWSMNARSTWREEFFTLSHLLWSQAPRWGDCRLASQWVHSPIYSHPWSSPLETYSMNIHELISRIS